MKIAWKKIIVLVVASTMMLSLCACGNDEVDKEDTSEDIALKADTELTENIESTETGNTEGDIQSVKDTDYAKEWEQENDYLTFPGWEIEALADLYKENAASFKMQFVGQVYSITGVIATIESDHIELISKSDEYKTSYYYYISAYLPTEEIANLSLLDSITIVGEFAESTSNLNYSRLIRFRG